MIMSETLKKSLLNSFPDGKIYEDELMKNLFYIHLCGKKLVVGIMFLCRLKVMEISYE